MKESQLHSTQLLLLYFLIINELHGGMSPPKSQPYLTCFTIPEQAWSGETCQGRLALGGDIPLCNQFIDYLKILQ